MLGLLASGPAWDSAGFAEQPPGKLIPVVTLAGSINPAVAEFVVRQIAKAEKEKPPPWSFNWILRAVWIPP